MSYIKSKIILFIASILLVATSYGQALFKDIILAENIKTVSLYPENNPLGESVYFINNPNSLVLKFDELADDYRDFAYQIIHCDANWKASDLSPNEYLDGYTEAYIKEYTFSQNTKIPYVHYQLTIPNSDIQFRYSGNYILKVYADGQADNPVFTKKFYVVNQLCTIGGDIIAASNPSLRNSAQEVSFKVNISNVNSRFPAREITTQIQQNGRYDNQINALEPLSIRDEILDFNLQKDNVFPGLNTFRAFNFSNLSYNSEYVYTIDRTGAIDEVELLLEKPRTGKSYKNDPTQFGKFYIETKNYSDTDSESEYALVQFLLSQEQPYENGDVYLLGAFDLWSLSHKLNYDYNSKVYYTKVLLKQGYYSYLYALKNTKNNSVDVSKIENSYFQTPNEYIVRVYYRAPSSTYDQLVGWQKLVNYTE